MRILIFVAFFFLFIEDSFAKKNDPSAIPLRKAMESRSGERYRITGDFNRDQIKDMALSIDLSMFGNSGGHFQIYLGDGEGNYREFGKMFFLHPKAVSLEEVTKGADDSITRIWAYLRASSGQGAIGYYEVKQDGLSEFKSITINPGDSGSDMGNKIYNAVFKDSSQNLGVEISETINGKVTWKKAF